MAFPKSVVNVRLSMTGNTAILEDRGSPQSRAPLPRGCRDARPLRRAHVHPNAVPGMASPPQHTPGASSPAVESGFLPGPQLVRPRRDGIRKLDKLAAEGGFAQEQDKGVEPPDRANQS